MSETFTKEELEAITKFALDEKGCSNIFCLTCCFWKKHSDGHQRCYLIDIFSKDPSLPDGIPVNAPNVTHHVSRHILDKMLSDILEEQ